MQATPGVRAPAETQRSDLCELLPRAAYRARALLLDDFTEPARLQQLGRVLNIGIIPLLIAFVLIVAFKVAEALK